MKQYLTFAHQHGQHDSTQPVLVSALVHLYELLAADYPSVRAVFLQVPGVQQTELQVS